MTDKHVRSIYSVSCNSDVLFNVTTNLHIYLMLDILNMVFDSGSKTEAWRSCRHSSWIRILSGENGKTRESSVTFKICLVLILCFYFVSININFKLRKKYTRHEEIYFRLAFERALELQPDNVSALSALAILDQNSMTMESVASAVTALMTAYGLEVENPVVLTHLANHFFYKGVS